VFIDFWGTWCKGCVEEIPTLKKIYQDIDKDKFEFISIACHDSPQKLKTFIDKEQIRWPQILSDDTNKIADLYGVRGFPTSVLINSQGMIIAKNLPPNILRDKLKELSK
jgi:thiol-disulfide isomerase/thioredoxin